jgi:hypothetical protein
LELETKSPFPGEPSHIVVARRCNIRGCRATTPCYLNHEQVIVRFQIDGRDYPEIKLAKGSFDEMSKTFPEPRELFHLLADMAVNANQPQGDLPKMADIAAAQAALSQGGIW